jgi:hypothetical protein
MKKKKQNKAFDRDFNPLKNKSVCYIHKDSEEILVFIERQNNIFKLWFTFKSQVYISHEIIIKNMNDLVSPSRIKFDGIELNSIDLGHLSDCIDNMVDNVPGIS